MGVVNVTPDSFSDGGETPDTEAAIARGRGLIAAGADIIDVGGESTRPGAAPLDPKDERARVLPVIRALAAQGAVVSVDTRHAAVMAAAVAAGARIVNDVSALSAEPGSLAQAAKSGAHVILMHMKGDPRTMQDDPRYDDVVAEVVAYLASRIEACVRAGIPRAKIAVDPGIGFGKTTQHNLALLAALPELVAAGTPVVLGVSRKGFLGRLTGGAPVEDRLEASVAVAAQALGLGVQVVRVHDVADTVAAKRLVAEPVTA